VIEVGLQAPGKLAPYADYEKAAASVRRSFDTMFRASADDILGAVRRGPIRLEIGNVTSNRTLAVQIMETLGAVVGRRTSVDECTNTSLADAGCRLIIGTYEGLAGHPEIGRHFKETLYNRYIEWDGQLISAPLAVELPGGKQPAFCLIAPRPEQLVRLAMNLASAAAQKARPAGSEHPDAQWDNPAVTASVPAGRPVLRFRPLMKLVGAFAMPNDLSLVRYEINAERDGKRTLVWREDIPPFCTFRGQGVWWGDRIVSVADLAGQNVTFHFTAAHVDGRNTGPMAQGGFDHVALLSLPQ
jgi:hypothetical protein